MAQKWNTNPAIHPVDLAYSATATEHVKRVAHTPSGKEAGFAGGPPVQTGDPENLKGQAYAEALFDGANLPGLDVFTGFGIKSKFSGEYADADRPHREKQNRFGPRRPAYGKGNADR